MPYGNQSRAPGYPPPGDRGVNNFPRPRTMSRNPSANSLDNFSNSADDASNDQYGPPGEVIYMQGSPGGGRPPIRRGPSTSGDFTHSGLPPRPMLPPLPPGPGNGIYNPNPYPYPPQHPIAHTNAISRSASHSRSGSFSTPANPPPLHPQPRSGMPPLVHPPLAEFPHPNAQYPPSRSISRSLSRSGSFRSPSPPSPIYQGDHFNLASSSSGSEPHSRRESYTSPPQPPIHSYHPPQPHPNFYPSLPISQPPSHTSTPSHPYAHPLPPHMFHHPGHPIAYDPHFHLPSQPPSVYGSQAPSMHGSQAPSVYGSQPPSVYGGSVYSGSRPGSPSASRPPSRPLSRNPSFSSAGAGEESLPGVLYTDMMMDMPPPQAHPAPYFHPPSRQPSAHGLQLVPLSSLMRGHGEYSEQHPQEEDEEYPAVGIDVSQMEGGYMPVQPIPAHHDAHAPVAHAHEYNQQHEDHEGQHAHAAKKKKRDVKFLAYLCCAGLGLLLVVVGVIILIVFLVGTLGAGDSGGGGLIDLDDYVAPPPPLEALSASVSSCSTWLSPTCVTNTANNDSLFVLDNVYVLVNYSDVEGAQRRLDAHFNWPLKDGGEGLVAQRLVGSSRGKWGMQAGIRCDPNVPTTASLTPVSLMDPAPLGTTSTASSAQVTCSLLSASPSADSPSPTPSAPQALQYIFMTPPLTPGKWLLEFFVTDTHVVKQNISITMRGVNNPQLLVPFYDLYANPARNNTDTAAQTLVNQTRLYGNSSFSIFDANFNMSLLPQLLVAGGISSDRGLTSEEVVVLGEVLGKLAEIVEEVQDVLYVNQSQLSPGGEAIPPTPLPLLTTSSVLDTPSLSRLYDLLSLYSTSLALLASTPPWSLGGLVGGAYLSSLITPTLQAWMRGAEGVVLDLSGRVVFREPSGARRRLQERSGVSASGAVLADSQRAQEVLAGVWVRDQQSAGEEEDLTPDVMPSVATRPSHVSASSTMHTLATATPPTIALFCGPNSPRALPMPFDTSLSFNAESFAATLAPTYPPLFQSIFDTLSGYGRGGLASNLRRFADFDDVLASLTPLLGLNQTYVTYATGSVESNKMGALQKVRVNVTLLSPYCTAPVSSLSSAIRINCTCPTSVTYPLLTTLTITPSVLPDASLSPPSYTLPALIRVTPIPDPPAAPTWVPCDNSVRNWTNLITSLDGRIVYAGDRGRGGKVINGVGGGTNSSFGGGLFKSVDRGGNWTRVGVLAGTTGSNSTPPFLTFDIRDIKTTSDGSRVFIAAGNIYRSNDAGATFTQVLGPPTTEKMNRTTWNYFSVACSSTGRFVYTTNVVYSVVNEVDYIAPSIRRSTNFGDTWSTLTNLNILYPRSIACSADGRTVYMAGQDNNMYCSLNSGASWTRIQTETYLSLPFVKAVSSLDGGYGLGVIYDQSFFFQPLFVYQRTTYRNFRSTFVSAATLSSDGRVVFALCATAGKARPRICTSVDYGATFTISFNTLLAWSDISISGDASTAYATVFGGGIYKYELP
eukprot:gene25185-30418_t